MKKKALVIRLSSLGDVVLSSMVLDYLCNLNFEVDFLTYSDYEALFTGDPRIRNLFAIERRGDNSKILHKISENKYNLLLDLHTKIKTTFIRKRYVKAQKTYLWNAQRLKRFLFLFTGLPVFKPEHVLERLHQDAYLKGYRPRLFVRDEDEREFFNLAGIEKGDKYIAVSPGSIWKSKKYNRTFLKIVVENIIEKGNYRVVIAVPPGEDFSEFKRTGAIVLNLSIPILKACLKNASITLSNDSGTFHLSEALGTPVLVLYTSTSPLLGFTPFRKESSYLWSGLICSPCSLHGRNWCLRGLKCTTSIPPEEVIKNINLLFSE